MSFFSVGSVRATDRRRKADTVRRRRSLIESVAGDCSESVRTKRVGGKPKPTLFHYSRRHSTTWRTIPRPRPTDSVKRVLQKNAVSKRKLTLRVKSEHIKIKRLICAAANCPRLITTGSSRLERTPKTARPANARRHRRDDDFTNTCYNIFIYRSIPYSCSQNYTSP